MTFDFLVGLYKTSIRLRVDEILQPVLQLSLLLHQCWSTYKELRVAIAFFLPTFGPFLFPLSSFSFFERLIMCHVGDELCPLSPQSSIEKYKPDRDQCNSLRREKSKVGHGILPSKYISDSFFSGNVHTLRRDCWTRFSRKQKKEEHEKVRSNTRSPEDKKRRRCVWIYFWLGW